VHHSDEQVTERLEKFQPTTRAAISIAFIRYKQDWAYCSKKFIELFSKETGKKMSYAHISEEAATYDLNQVESL
jgi:hypothetical protein